MDFAADHSLETTHIAYSRGVGVVDTRPEQRTAPDFEAFAREVLGDIGAAPPPDASLAAFKRTAPIPWFAAPIGGDGRRVADNAKPWPLLVLDIDAVQPEEGKQPRELLVSFIDAVRAVAPCFGYTSLSSTYDAPRFRLVLHLSRIVTAPESKTLARVLCHHLADKLGVNVHGTMPAKADPPYLVVDSSMHAGSHIAFTPVDGFKRIPLVEDAPPLDVDSWLARLQTVPCSTVVAMKRDCKPESREHIDDVKAALAVIPPSCGRDMWLEVGFAIRSLDWECGHDLFYEWSLGAPEKYDERDFQGVWNGSVPKRADKKSITHRTLFQIAKKFGYVRRSARLIDPADSQFAKDFLEAYGHELMFVQGRDWLHWTGSVWSQDDCSPNLLAIAFSDMRLEDARRALETDYRNSELQRTVAAAEKLRSRAKRLTMLSDAADMARVVSSRLDAYPHLLCVANGAVELPTLAFFPPASDLLLTRQCTQPYIPEGPDPALWLETLQRWHGGDQSLIDFLQEWLGSAASGVHSRDIVYSVGEGGDGKSVIAEVCHDIFGSYSTALDRDVITMGRASSGQGPKPELAKLVGVRFVTVAELTGSRTFDTGLIKALTGGDTLSASFKFKDNFDFRPHVHLHMMGNGLPAVKGETASAFWERFHVLPYRTPIPLSERDPTFREKLVEQEGPAILRWILEGARRWYANGCKLKPPPIVVQATAEYRGDSDPVRQWMSDCVASKETNDFTLVADAFESYKLWCRHASLREPNKIAFGRALTAIGVAERNDRTRGRGRRLKLKTDDGEGFV